MDRAPRWLFWALGLPVVPAFVWMALDFSSVKDDLARPRDLHDAEYLESGECQRCHPSQFASWNRTFHSTMTQEATGPAVLGDFDDARLSYGGVEARMERDPSGRPTMRFIGPNGREWSRATVVRTIGSRRYQQYLAADGDVLFRLPVAWHIEEQRWFHMNGAFLTPDPPFEGSSIAPSDYYRHVTRWNDNCIFCHNVAPNPGRRSEPGGVERWRTEVAELGIACGACHGPAEEHARVNRDPLRRYALHLSDEADPTIVNPSRLTPGRSAQVCGRCHGQRIAPNVERFMHDGDPYLPGDELRDYTQPLTRNTPLDGDHTAFANRFWPDGTARLTAYEYQGLLQSTCDELTCIDCHGMHEGDPRAQIRPEARGDAACTGCHEASLADQPHTGHRTQVECVECHMPRIVYGVIGVHRSHRIEVPRPRTDRPNACALCHADRTDAWIASGHERLYGDPPIPTPPAARANALPRVHRDALAGDPIERAVALAALGRTRGLIRRSRRAALLFDTLVEDPYPALRHIAHGSLSQLVDLPDGFVPEASREERQRWVDEASRGIDLDPPPRSVTQALRALAAHELISIGE